MTPHEPGPEPSVHLDVAGYVLGVLDPAERAAFDAHLAAGCPQCARQLAELTPVGTLLAEYAADGDPADPLPRPDPALLDRLVAEVGAVRRRGRVRRLALVVAAAAVALAGPAVTAAVITADTPPAVVAAAAAHRFTATNPATGANAVVGVDPAPWGSRITLELSGVPGPLTCDLVAVSGAGDRQTVTTWSVPATGYTAAALHTTGGTALPPTTIDHFEIRTLDTDTLLLTIPTRTP
ncbi:anti-sigma factor family protein [Kitasatospora purpeofusca]|uniref:anti-sigma factor family protein n=1 Tax=Kitasatospora purpeofusca TaxID=67352 RepID=UPI0022560B27|nr:zf-HC2 domain-containing protein [Kitasatospora purpeofusca]MCX4757982.1 zf-HC2 domain-containing protein [Kitasatospora purpeofusca]WSR31536.1 zf-HC2 domain-containing protein [Kitasatospora purpeofusca]WSR39561.1 zf-HC2 domain-containing protein [Kitasatospora purpeofusca]